VTKKSSNAGKTVKGMVTGTKMLSGPEIVNNSPKITGTKLISLEIIKNTGGGRKQKKNTGGGRKQKKK